MKKVIKQILSLLLSLIVCLSCLIIQGFAVETTEDTVYGIFIEDYMISYTITNDGVILIPVEYIADLHKLASDQKAIQKILRENAIANEKSYDEWNLSVDSSVISRSISSIQTEYPCAENVVVTDKTRAASLIQLTNFTSTITKKSQEALDGGGVKIRVRYHWYWNSVPFTGNNDIVTLAWTGSFAAQTTVTKLIFKEYGHPRKKNWLTGEYELDYFDPKTRETTYTGTDAYVNYTTKVGIQDNFPIDTTFPCDGYLCYVYKTEGIYYVSVYKRNMPNPDPGYLTFTGNYYHNVGLNPNNNDILTMTQNGPDPSSIPPLYRAGATCQQNINY